MNFLTTPIRILSNNTHLTGIQCIRTELGCYDASGRRSPVPVKGSEFKLDVNNLFIAVGESVDRAMLPKELEFTSQGTVLVNPDTLQTSVDSVFAGGDAVTGPRDVIGAIATGKEAAVSIDRYLKGVDLRQGRAIAARVLHRGVEAESMSQAIAITDEKAAIAEAKRCLNCGVCVKALENGLQPACVNACPSHCIYYRDVWEITPKAGPYTTA
jgi:heterodisulfide reductase subunit A